MLHINIRCNFLRTAVSSVLLVSTLMGNSLWVHAQDDPNVVTEPAQAEQGNKTNVFLPLVVNNTSKLSGSEGTTQVMNAGQLPVGSTAKVPTSGVKTLPRQEFPTGVLAAVECSIRDWKEEDYRVLNDRVLLNGSDGIIYPGAIVQGGELLSGTYTPVTIPRTGGKLWVEGIVLDEGAPYYAEVTEINGAYVQQAIQNLIGGKIRGTAAAIDYEVSQTYSYDQLLFNLGISGKYGIGLLGGSLKTYFDSISEHKKNTVFLKFVQKFYNINFEVPSTPISVFRDGENFQDPQQQIREGNPPLYVQKVSYGRVVLLIAESDYDAIDVKASLDAAYRGLTLEGKVNSGLTYQEVLARTTVHYTVIGGGADEGVKPIAAKPAEMFAAVNAYIASAKSATFSASNPGFPILYTLNYLSTNQVAKMSYFATYGQKDCKAIFRPPSRIVGQIGPFGGLFGEWHDWERCPVGEFAYQFSKKVEQSQRGGDDTALNGVSLDCKHPANNASSYRVTSAEGQWGAWEPNSSCPSGSYLVGASLRIEPSQGNGDDTGGVDVKFWCSDINRTVITTPTALNWGEWREPQFCPAGSVISSLATRIEASQAGGDDTALNDVLFECSSIP